MKAHNLSGQLVHRVGPDDLSNDVEPAEQLNVQPGPALTVDTWIN
jgi:hypothetical protein